MTSTLGIAISGLNAASLRASVSANNIANARTTSVTQAGETKSSGPYIPKDVIHTPQTTGGVLAHVVDVEIDPVQEYEPLHSQADSSGFVAYPNVDLADELVKLDEARMQYISNLKTIESQKDVSGVLLDIFV